MLNAKLALPAVAAFFCHRCAISVVDHMQTVVATIEEPVADPCMVMLCFGFVVTSLCLIK